MDAVCPPGRARCRSAGISLPAGRPHAAPDRPAHALARRLLAGLALLLTALALAAPFSAPSRAVEVEFTTRPVLRDILALYDGRHEKTPTDTRIHKFAEMPLNFLGFKLAYHDVNRPLPEGADLKRYRGIITWLVEPLARPVQYLQWLDRATESGLRLALVSGVAPPESEQMQPLVNRVLKRIGLQTTGEYVSITHKSRVVTSDPAMIGFERPIDKALPDFAAMSPASPDTTVHLAVEAPLRGRSITSALVTTSPGGAYVSDEYAAYYDGNIDRLRWIINPFLFFKLAFGPERFPVPDTTTLSGRRIYFSHIDGDGWNNVSEIEGYRQIQALSAEVIAKEAIEAYPDLPVTIGLIAGDIDPALGGNPAAAAIARRLYALPQVEIGSHTYTHPFEWGFFEHYDRDLEMQKIDKVQRPNQTVWDRVRVAALRMSGREPSSERLNKYIAGSADLPRSYMKNPFDVDLEVKGSLGVAEKLAPAGKKAKIMLWSGDTLPFEAILKATREAGARNMNGGDTRLDEEYPSVFYVPPIARTVGRERQIYAGNSNENTYTNFWHGPYYGYFNLAKTLHNTEYPRRLKPFNVYYHMYMGEKAAALASLKHFLDMARKTEVIPIPASQYAAIADDFFGVEIEQIGVASWSVSGRGALQTVRFDDADTLEVDPAESVGVIGATRKDGAMYVALDGAVAKAVVSLRTRGTTTTATPATAMRATVGAAAPATGTAAAGGNGGNGGSPGGSAGTGPWLVSSRWALDGRQALPCGASFTARGFGPGQMQWHASPGQAYDVTLERNGETLWRATTRAGNDGMLALEAPPVAREDAALRLVCQ